MTTGAPLALDPSQQRAVDLASTARLAVITGGPGTGKTTCLRSALDAIDLTTDRGNYALAAPTGKAARRLSETTGRAATTIHRLLSYGPLPFGGGFGFRYNRDNPIPHALVVVDESSMIDIALAQALFAAIDTERTRLVLVGDANQLPSVGPGRVFADLIESGRVPVARLTTLHRAAAESWVCSQAPRILAGEMPDLATRGDFVFAKCETRDEAAFEAYRQASPTAGLPQLLIPMRVGPVGTAALNARLQPKLNPVRDGEPEGWKVGGGTEGGGYTLREGDRVIQTSNDYKLGVFNGELGIVERIHPATRECDVCAGTGRVECKADASGFQAGARCWECGGAGKLPQQLVVRFPDVEKDRRVGYSRQQADGLQLAYALTVHKSQGSEWPWVVVVCHSTHTRMLTRGLLYTAVTRAKVGVVLVGDEAGLKRALSETRDMERNTGLVERLRAGAKAAA